MEGNIFCGCVDIGRMAVDAKTEELAPNWNIDNEQYTRLIQHFRDIDELMVENDGVSIDVGVDDMTVRVTIQCPSMRVGNGEGVFQRLLAAAESVDFYPSVGGDLRVCFDFGSVWRLPEPQLIR